MAATVDILEGNTFLVSDERGDIDGSPVEAHGLFDRDTRFLSRWVLTLDGQRLAPLSVDRTRYYAAQFFLAPGVASTYVNAKIAVIRSRTVFDGFHEVVTVTNHDATAVTVEVALAAQADFADLFEVKDAAVDKPGRAYRRAEANRLVLGYERESYRRETWIRASGDPVVDEAGLRFSGHPGAAAVVEHRDRRPHRAGRRSGAGLPRARRARRPRAAARPAAAPTAGAGAGEQLATSRTHLPADHPRSRGPALRPADQPGSLPAGGRPAVVHGRLRPGQHHHQPAGAAVHARAGRDDARDPGAAAGRQARTTSGTPSPARSCTS